MEKGRGLSSTANKKVFVTRFERESVHGYVQMPEGFSTHKLNLLSPAGTLSEIPYTEIKVVSFVRDFDAGETWRTHRSFASRPKTPGLWMRFSFRDGDITEAILPNNLALLDSTGFFVIPPDPSYQNQRLFLPREALSEARVLGVVGGRPLPKRKDKQQKPGEEQLEMFS